MRREIGNLQKHLSRLWWDLKRGRSVCKSQTRLREIETVNNTGNKQCLLMYCHISFNRPTVVATRPRLHIICVKFSLPQFTWWRVSEVVEENAIQCVNWAYYLAISSHLKFEIHVVMHLSQWRLQTLCQNINSSSSNTLALKGGAEEERQGGVWGGRRK